MTRQILLPSVGDLTAFEAAARHASFTRAAAELHLTQSAISRAVRMLEDRIGVTLFERVRQRVVLTAAGSLYLKEVRRILAHLREATHAVMSYADETATLNVAVLPTFATRWLVPRLPNFMAAHPDVTLNLAARLEPFDFGREPFDAAIHYGSPTWAASRCHHLMDEVTVVVASPEYRAARKLVRPMDLQRATLLHQSTRPRAWSDWCALVDVELEGVNRGPRYEQFAMIAQAAAAGLGAALLPRVLIEDELAAGRLEVLFEEALTGPSAYYWVVPEEKAASPALRAFTDWITAQAGA
ncbi:transcriptional regulator GcvA [Phenylobacterium sp. VNQ135]|uniref:transcriptional regulator GcvA n=1 Tax=Phenylobacterium sp. VNQ135 TaxID=3400922 RepID=UPI003C0E5AF4